MKTYEIKKTFKDYEASEKWINKNCPDRTYKGESILMINRSCDNVANMAITIDNIITL